MLTFQNTSDGILKAVLNIDELYTDSGERQQFFKRLDIFLACDKNLPRVFKRKNNRLVYYTEQIIPEKSDTRPPVLLLFGNPAPQSVLTGMFFSFERGGREHRLWKALRTSQFLGFSCDTLSDIETDINKYNNLRKKELYELRYYSPFRIGFVVFYSMPTPASSTGWDGVSGLRRLFGGKALEHIAMFEKARIHGIIQSFLSSKGTVIAFQKDAYNGMKSLESPGYGLVEAKEGRLFGLCECNPNIRLFCCPPTRLIHTMKYRIVLENYIKRILE